jgi:vacuolar-type H+-ATPase subunit C/Vma6
MRDWGDVVARARGLSSQLLRRDDWRTLCAARDVDALWAQLAASGAAAAPGADAVASPRALEAAIRRRAGARVRLLAQWAGPRATLLSPLFDDDDRRALRALVRGAVAHVPAGDRTAGLIPTPTLPMRALEQLATLPDVAAIAALCTVWRHPFAPALSAEASRQHPDLFLIEAALARAFALRAVAAARRADASMRAYVSRVIDAENLWTALALADGAPDVDPASVFLPGGAVIRLADLTTAARTQSIGAFEAAIRARTVGTPLARALDADPRAREDRFLDAMIDEVRRDARREPLGTAPIVAFFLRQRREVRVLQGIAWGIALGAGRTVLERTTGVAA